MFLLSQFRNIFTSVTKCSFRCLVPFIENISECGSVWEESSQPERDEAPLSSMCFQTQHIVTRWSLSIPFFSKSCHELTTAVWNLNGDITVHALEKNKQAAMPMSRTDQQDQWLFFFQLQKKLQTLLKCWMSLPCIPMLSKSLQWCQRLITLEFNKTICYSVKIKLWFFVLRR